MSEKIPKSHLPEVAASDVPMSEILKLAESGFKDQAHRLVTMKLELLKTVVVDIRKAGQEKNGVISKEDWQKEEVFIKEQISELEAFLTTLRS